MLITNIPLPLLSGFSETCEAAGIHLEIGPDGVYASDVSAAQSLFATYSGSAAELAWWKAQKQIALDALFDAHFDLAKFIRDGTATNVTANNVGTFLSTITNNYRSKRANISAAVSVAAVQAVNVNSGWPSNP